MTKKQLRTLLIANLSKSKLFEQLHTKDNRLRGDSNSRRKMEHTKMIPNVGLPKSARRCATIAGNFVALTLCLCPALTARAEDPFWAIADAFQFQPQIKNESRAKEVIELISQNIGAPEQEEYCDSEDAWRILLIRLGIAHQKRDLKAARDAITSSIKIFERRSFPEEPTWTYHVHWNRVSLEVSKYLLAAAEGNPLPKEMPLRSANDLEISLIKSIETGSLSFTFYPEQAYRLAECKSIIASLQRRPFVLPEVWNHAHVISAFIVPGYERRACYMGDDIYLDKSKIEYKLAELAAVAALSNSNGFGAREAIDKGLKKCGALIDELDRNDEWYVVATDRWDIYRCFSHLTLMKSRYTPLEIEMIKEKCITIKRGSKMFLRSPHSPPLLNLERDHRNVETPEEVKYNVAMARYLDLWITDWVEQIKDRAGIKR